MLQEDLQNALRQIDDLKVRNRKPEANLLLAGDEKRRQCLQNASLQIVWWSVTQCCGTLEQYMQV